MTKLSEIINELSVPACEVLAGMPGARIGTVVPREPAGLWRELAGAGVVGANGGLTILGSAVAEKLQREHLEAMFG